MENTPEYVYLDWNIFNKIEKRDELDTEERRFYDLIESLAIEGKIVCPYSNAHINDLYRGYLKNPNFVNMHFSTISRLTHNLCVVQYWGEKQSKWHFRNPEEFLISTIEETEQTAGSFSQLFESFDDKLLKLAFDIQKLQLKLMPVPETFRQVFKTDPFFNLMYPRTKIDMNYLSLCDDLYDFAFRIKKDYLFYKVFKKQLNDLRIKFPQYAKLVQNTHTKIIGLPAQLTWDTVWDHITPDFKESSNPSYDKIVNLFVTTDLKGYKQDERFANLVDDALHCFYAAHCHYFITIDGRCYDKAKKVYDTLGISTKVMKPEEFSRCFTEKDF